MSGNVPRCQGGDIKLRAPLLAKPREAEEEGYVAGNKGRKNKHNSSITLYSIPVPPKDPTSAHHL
jgi:hypothetical protein